MQQQRSSTKRTNVGKIGEKAAAFAYHAGAVHPHTSVLLRDFQPWEDMNTDGSRLRASYGVPGIGMYMMEDRCPYHTVYDDLSHIIRGNLQAHGNNFVGVSRAVTRNEAILDMWAKSDSDPSGDAYTIDLLSSSMLLLTPATMAVLYSLLGISVIAVVCVVAFMEPQGRTTALVDLSLLACAHVASIGAGLVVTFVLAFCVGANFGYWYRRDGMAVWLYIFPSLCVQLSFGRLLLFKRFYGVSAEFIQWRSSTAAVILLLLLTLLLAMAGLHMSLLFGMCALTRLAGFLLRIGIGFIAQRAKKESRCQQIRRLAGLAWDHLRAYIGITGLNLLARCNAFCCVELYYEFGPRGSNTSRRFNFGPLRWTFRFLCHFTEQWCAGAWALHTLDVDGVKGNCKKE